MDVLATTAGWILGVGILFLALWMAASVCVGNPFSLLRRRLLSTFLLEHIRALVTLRLPLAPALSACAERLSNASQRDLRDVEEGISRKGLLIGDALARVPTPRRLWLGVWTHRATTPTPRLVSPAEAETLRIAEMTGNLPDGIDLILRERQRFAQLRSWLYGTFFYVAAIFLIGATVLTGILTFVVPKFKKMFDELNVQLPVMTQAVIGASDFAAQWWWLVLVGLAAVVLLLVRGRRFRPLERGQGRLREYLERMAHLPGFLLSVTRRALLAEFCTELSMLLKVHVPAHRALRLLADGTLNPWFRDRVRKAADLCEQGVPLADALDQVGLDRRAAWFARGAANAPDLSEALARLAEDCRTQTSWAAAVAGRLLPPVVVLCIGIVVGTTVLSLFLPLIKLMNSLGG